MWEAALIGAGATLLGGAMSEEAADDRNAANLGFSREQLAMQKQMAQEGIRWRVADAQAAGIHPLYAIGAPPMSFSPVNTFSEGPSFGMGEALAKTGQDISRAMDSTRTEQERVDARVQSLQLEEMGLRNDLLRAQIAKLQADQVGPPMAGSPYLIPGQTGSGVVVDKPLERIGAHPERTHQEPGAITDVGFARTATGLVPVPSSDVKQRIEDNIFQEAMHFLRNNLRPNWSGDRGLEPPASALPPGASHWRWSYSAQEWQPAFGPRRVPSKFRGNRGPGFPESFTQFP